MNNHKNNKNNKNNKNMNTNIENTTEESIENNNNRNNMYPVFTSLLKTDINKMNEPLYSTYNMVDIEDILYFFSKDVERKHLLKLFRVQNTQIQTPKLLQHSITIEKPKDLFSNLIQHLDAKYRETDIIVINNSVEKQKFTAYLESINKNYAKISCNDDKFAGWDYYNENCEFIKEYFPKKSKLKDLYSVKRHIIPYRANTPEKQENQLTIVNTPTVFIPLYSINNPSNESGKGNDENDSSEGNESYTKHKSISYNPENTYIYINVIIGSIDDILLLIDKYPLRKHIQYNINMRAIHAIGPALKRLNGMIGLSMMKDSIVDQIIYYIQDFHKLGNNSKDFMHTVIYGPPGTGKTEIAKIIGEIFSKLGMLKNNTFKKVTRADLVAGYLGQTAIKTKNIIKESLGGVLFIDEAYALGNNEKGDSFSKECIDTLCEALSDYKDEIMVIIAGYKDELKNCFFNYNEGLESRFAWRFATQKYTACELKDIFIKKVKDAEWELRQDIDKEWFEKNYESFKHQGRDIETLFAKSKIAHSRRVFCKPIHYKTRLTVEDIDGGFSLYKRNKERNKTENLSKFSHMYV